MGGEPNQGKKTKKVAPAQLFFARKHRMPEKKAPPRRNDMKEKDPKKKRRVPQGTRRIRLCEKSYAATSVPELTWLSLEEPKENSE